MGRARHFIERYRTGRRRAAAIAFAGALVLGLAPAAAAQDDPYGPTSTTTEPPAAIQCRIASQVVVPGRQATVEVLAPPAGALLRVLIGSNQVAQTSVPDPAPASLNVTFRVPELAEGVHTVSIVGVDFTIRCGVGDLTDGVQGVRVERPTGGAGGSGPGTDAGAGRANRNPTIGGVDLPVTGIAAGLLVAVALALLVIGRTLVGFGRADRRARSVEAALLAAGSGRSSRRK